MHAEAKGSLPPGRLQRLTLTRAITLTSTVSGREKLLKKTPKHPFAAVLRFIRPLTALTVRRRDGRHTGHAPHSVRGVDTRLKRSLLLHFSKDQSKDGNKVDQPTFSRTSVWIFCTQTLWSGYEMLLITFSPSCQGSRIGLWRMEHIWIESDRRARRDWELWHKDWCQCDNCVAKF